MATKCFSMPSSSMLLLFSFAFGLSGARPWNGPAKTAAYQGDNWSPRPTSIPVDPRELFAREQHVDIAVCGWVGGDVASPVACATGSSCVHDTIHGFVGCCATAGPCTAGVYTTCIDQNNKNWGSIVDVVDSGVFTCPSGSYCYQNAYPGGYSQYNCGNPTEAGTVQTSFSGQATDLLLQVVYTGVVFTPSTLPSSTATSPTTSSPASSSPQTSTSPTPSSSSPISITSVNSSPTTTSTPSPVTAGISATTTEAAHSSSNSKAIIGGVVGGLAALTAIVGLFLFFLQRRHAKRSPQRSGSTLSFQDKYPPSGPFQRMPYSPDTFESMAERDRPTPSTIAAAFPNNHLTPPGPATQAVFPSSDLADQRRHQGEYPSGSEIDEFARGFNEVAQYHHHPLDDVREIDPEYHYAISGFEVPLFSPHSPHMDPTISELDSPTDPGTMASMGGLRRGGSGDTARNRQRERDRLMGESKEEDEGSPSLTMSSRMTSNIREEGWSPPQLRPNATTTRARDEQAWEGRPRYQLVDEVPREGVQILHQPGQLRGGRPARGRNSP